MTGKQPGWEQDSYGWHGDDGKLFSGDGVTSTSDSYGPPFGPGDVVGCGLDYTNGAVFFTLNGQYMGVAFENASGGLYPVVGLDALSMITFNFGANPAKPFVFDLLGFERQLHGDRALRALEQQQVLLSMAADFKRDRQAQKRPKHRQPQ